MKKEEEKLKLGGEMISMWKDSSGTCLVCRSRGCQKIDCMQKSARI